MNINEVFRRTASDALERQKIGALPFFIFLCVSSTAASGIFLYLIDDRPNFADSGVQLILLVTASACYAAIWQFVKAISTSPRN